MNNTKPIIQKSRKDDFPDKLISEKFRRYYEIMKQKKSTPCKKNNNVIIMTKDELNNKNMKEIYIDERKETSQIRYIIAKSKNSHINKINNRYNKSSNRNVSALFYKNNQNRHNLFTIKRRQLILPTPPKKNIANNQVQSTHKRIIANRYKFVRYRCIIKQKPSRPTQNNISINQIKNRSLHKYNRLPCNRIITHYKINSNIAQSKNTLNVKSSTITKSLIQIKPPNNNENVDKEKYDIFNTLLKSLNPVSIKDKNLDNIVPEISKPNKQIVVYDDIIIQ